MPRDLDAEPKHLNAPGPAPPHGLGAFFALGRVPIRHHDEQPPGLGPRDELLRRPQERRPIRTVHVGVAPRRGRRFFKSRRGSSRARPGGDEGVDVFLIETPVGGGCGQVGGC